MKYTTQIEIYLPREKVIEIFGDSSNMIKWMPGLKHVELINGEINKQGAESKLSFDINGRKTEMLEKIIENNLPNYIKLNYDAKGVHNIVISRFYDEGQFTKWEMQNEFHFSGFMKVLGFFMRSTFPKQTLKNMYHFKKFAENIQ